MSAESNASFPEGRIRIAILTTGGTIEKTYDERSGDLRNVRSVLELILHELRLPTVEIRQFSVMSKDSRDMGDADREAILSAVKAALYDNDAVMIVHGTDTLALTGEHLHSRLPDLKRPIVLVGAMRPFEFRDTDAFQNVTEAMIACRLAAPGVYAVMHSQVLRFPGVLKDVERGTFCKPNPAPGR